MLLQVNLIFHLTFFLFINYVFEKFKFWICFDVHLFIFLSATNLNLLILALREARDIQMHLKPLQRFLDDLEQVDFEEVCFVCV